MNGQERSQEYREAVVKLRLARAIGGAVWAFLKGIFYGLGLLVILIAISREIASRH